jgi:hypothetical protein
MADFHLHFLKHSLFTLFVLRDNQLETETINQTVDYPYKVCVR